MTAGNGVMDVRRSVRNMGYVFSNKGSVYEAERHICVSGTWLFYSCDEVVFIIRKISAVGLPSDRRRHRRCNVRQHPWC